ncbi:hypothetical protein ACM39_12605 [Chryseobacterium sp. FH2]|uniref:hypothetical protein n=1 Tax=Chryseobacterium sp. FH2 TaxID=1674291 RepID=UPI00065AC12C|nr:hypothetical protein [Chryseobacterium sp. FH2]KMQ67689.1 hypothetical protein ACM39_12605 [Chryseobacterium sp. FH2]
MEIDEKHIKIRKELAKDIRTLSNVLYSYFPTASLGNLEAAITFLSSNRAVVLDKVARAEYWGYNVKEVCFKLDKFPEKRHPKDIENLELILDFELVGNCDDIDSLKDPFLWLIFDIKIKGIYDKKDFFTSYHLDRHLYKAGDMMPVEPHPFYHFQYGGKHILDDNKTVDSGKLIIFESPRIAHYPMELILGIDYILSHFFPDKRIAILKSEQEYVNLIEKYQARILKPYYHTISSTWNYDHNSLNIGNHWTPSFLCPQLIINS